MRSALLSSRSRPIPAQAAEESPSASSNAMPQYPPSYVDHQGDGVIDPDTYSMRHVGSRVWSDVRGALKAMSRASQNASETYDFVTDGSLAGTRSISLTMQGNNQSGGHIMDLAPNGARTSVLKKRELVRKLRTFGMNSTGTVVLRSRQGRRRSSVHRPVNIQSVPSSEASGSPASSGKSTGDDGRMGKFSVESRSSAVARDLFFGRNLRRSYQWARSAPDFFLSRVEGSVLSQFNPTVTTVERAAAAKIYLETHFNEKLNRQNSRDVRSQYLETQLYYSPHLTEEQKHSVRASFWAQESCHTREFRTIKSRIQPTSRQKYSNPCTKQYEPLKVLGKGSFGVVRLVQERLDENAPARPKQVYAMKVIRKSNMLCSSQEGHLRAERDFLVASEGAKWIMALICSFQDTSNLYMVMEYMPGGDFLGLLIRESILPEAVSRFYIAEMILAVEETHRLRYIHRDIKPDNFLISPSGHLKISDFGLAFDGHWSHDTSYYNYHRYSLLSRLGLNVDGDDLDKRESREIQRQIEKTRNIMSGVDRYKTTGNSSSDDCLEELLDWRNRHGNRSSAHSMWSIGIILFECLYGHTPFLSDKGRRETKQNVADHEKNFRFPLRPYVSDKCQDLMYRLIRDKDTRICSKRYQYRERHRQNDTKSHSLCGHHVFPDDAEDIKAHRWFKNVPWDRLHTITPPFVPQVRGPEDTRYFDESGSIDDMSDSDNEAGGASPEKAKEALKEFRPSCQNLALDLVAESYDTVRLRSIDRQIETSPAMTATEKDLLKQFVRVYGNKEPKRPRDKMLRDGKTRDMAMYVRKSTAFMGYTWRRVRPVGYLACE